MRGTFTGMGATMRRFLTPSVNERYPDRKKTLPPRSRMSFELPRNDAGDVNCKSCGLCAKNCPDNAITVESVKREDGPGRVLTRFVIDLGVCMYCGLCVENCPSEGIRFTGNFEVSTPDRSGTLLVLEDQPAPAAVAPIPAPADGAPHGAQDALASRAALTDAATESMPSVAAEGGESA